MTIYFTTDIKITRREKKQSKYCVINLINTSKISIISNALQSIKKHRALAFCTVTFKTRYKNENFCIQIHIQKVFPYPNPNKEISADSQVVLSNLKNLAKSAILQQYDCHYTKIRLENEQNKTIFIKSSRKANQHLLLISFFPKKPVFSAFFNKTAHRSK